MLKKISNWVIVMMLSSISAAASASTAATDFQGSINFTSSAINGQSITCNNQDHIIFYIANNTNTTLYANYLVANQNASSTNDVSNLTQQTLAPGNAVDYEFCGGEENTAGAVAVGPYVFIVQHGSIPGNADLTDGVNGNFLNYQLGSVSSSGYTDSNYTWGIYSITGPSNIAFTNVTPDYGGLGAPTVGGGAPSGLTNSSKLTTSTVTSGVLGYFYLAGCKGDNCHPAAAEIDIESLPGFVYPQPLGASAEATGGDD